MIEDMHDESLLEKHDVPAVKANAKGDKRNIFLLFVLYTLQGLPLGLSLSIPLIMQIKHRSSFSDQGMFSFAVWPFSLKLLWAPLVDALYIRRLGRRKSWLIPVQYALGIFFLATGFCINKWLVDADKPNVMALTLMFFTLNFLAATQDIIVDGWAITMLKRKNVRYAAMCNGAGQAFGIYIGFVFLMILISETIWNKFRSTPAPGGLISLEGYFYFWGIMFIVVTTLVALFKSEKDYLTETDAVHPSITKTYKLLLSIIKLPNIKMLAIILLTVKVSFGSLDGALKLKLIDQGISKEQIAVIELLFLPIRISLPFILPKITSKEKPLMTYFNTIPYRLLIGVVLTICIYFIPTCLATKGAILSFYKLCFLLVYFIEQITVCMMMLTIMAFYANISDPKIGGTNMTLLSTIGNIGMIWSKTAALWLIDLLTFCICSKDQAKISLPGTDWSICKDVGGTCRAKVDGFYLETVLCTIYGIIWYFLFKNSINNLQYKSVKEWHVEVVRKQRL